MKILLCRLIKSRSFSGFSAQLIRGKVGRSLWPGRLVPNSLCRLRQKGRPSRWRSVKIP